MTAHAGAGAHRLPEAEARNWAVAAHLAGLITFLGIPGPVGPAVVWLIKRDEHRLVDQHGREALNFQLSLWIYGLVAGAAMLVLLITIVGILLIPFVLVLLLVLGICSLIFPIIAAVKTSDGKSYSYPLTMRLIT